MRRRSSWTALTSILLVAALFAAACSSDSGDDTTTTAGDGATTTAPGEPQTGGTLRVVDTAEPVSLNFVLQTPKNNQRNQLAILEPFVAANKQNSAITTDGLATGWEQIDDLTWRFTIREGVSFHNGEPLNAAAVVFSFDQARYAEGTRVVSFLRSIVEATEVDEYTVDFKTETPDAAAPARLNVMQVVPPVYYAEVGAEQFGLAPVGTGPFVFDEWVPGQYIRVVRNDDYWAGPAYLDAIEFRWAGEAAARVAAIESGDADLTVNLPPSIRPTIQEGVVVNADSQSSLFLAFNTFEPPFDDVIMRQAINHALDRDAIVDGIYEGAATANPDLYPPDWPSTGGHGDAYFEYDPDRARELIAEYEAANGELESVELHWPTARYPSVDEVGEAVAGMLENVGLTVVRDPREPGEFFDTLFDGEVGDMHLSGFNVRFAHEDAFMASRFVSTALARYCHDDPELDARVNAAVAITDQAERTATYNELERFFILERVCWAPVVYLVDVYAASPQLRGFEPRPDELIDFQELWLES